MNALADAQRQEAPEYTEQYARKALTLARSIAYPKGQGEAFIHLGAYCNIKKSTLRHCTTTARLRK
ncbi:MAG: hypothetical protein HC880_06175 [Bacteroidia bacterium]|nr:hypothetical protein [Bacteroidia bacterium]